MFEDIISSPEITVKEFIDIYCSVCDDYGSCQADGNVHKSMLKDCMANRWSLTPKIKILYPKGYLK